MLKSLTGLVHTIGDQHFQFTCDPNAPLESVEEALFQFMNYLRQVKTSAAKAQAEKAAEEAKAPEEASPKKPKKA